MIPISWSAKIQKLAIANFIIEGWFQLNSIMASMLYIYTPGNVYFLGGEKSSKCKNILDSKLIIIKYTIFSINRGWTHQV